MDKARPDSRSLLVSFFAVFCLSACKVGTQTAISPTLQRVDTASPEGTQPAPIFPIPTGYRCEHTLILEWPVIDSATPDPASSGSTVELLGHGGVIRCGNGYDESSRDFDVLLDDLRIGSINCYVNHCEGRVQIPENLEAGIYSLRIGPENIYTLDIR